MTDRLVLLLGGASAVAGGVLWVVKTADTGRTTEATAPRLHCTWQRRTRLFDAASATRTDGTEAHDPGVADLVSEHE